MRLYIQLIDGRRALLTPIGENNVHHVKIEYQVQDRLLKFLWEPDKEAPVIHETSKPLIIRDYANPNGIYDPFTLAEVLMNVSRNIVNPVRSRQPVEKLIEAIYRGEHR